MVRNSYSHWAQVLSLRVSPTWTYSLSSSLNVQMRGVRDWPWTYGSFSDLMKLEWKSIWNQVASESLSATYFWSFWHDWINSKDWLVPTRFLSCCWGFRWQRSCSQSANNWNQKCEFFWRIIYNVIVTLLRNSSMQFHDGGQLRKSYRQGQN